MTQLRVMYPAIRWGHRFNAKAGGWLPSPSSSLKYRQAGLTDVQYPFHTSILLYWGFWRRVVENKRSSDDESSAHAPRVCMIIHPEGQSCEHVIVCWDACYE